MPRPSPWLMTPALVAGTWLLSAQSPQPDAQIAALEKRVADLEALITRSGNVTRIKGPFMVMGQDGRPILEVLNSPNLDAIGVASSGAVIVTSNPGLGGVLGVRDKGGKFGVQLTGFPGVGVYNAAGDRVMAMTSTPEGKGRFYIEDKGKRLVLIEDSAGAGSIALMKGTGQTVAMLGAASGGAGRLALMGAEGGIGAALMGDRDGGGFLGLATRNGQTFAQAGISSDGRGLFQVFAPGGAAVAVMGQGGPSGAGIFQVANAGGVKASLTTAAGGGGMLQLISEGGVPTVEAGTLPNGRGVVRAGPFFKCVPITPSTPVIGIPGWTDCIVGAKDDK